MREGVGEQKRNERNECAEICTNNFEMLYMYFIINHFYIVHYFIKLIYHKFTYKAKTSFPANCTNVLFTFLLHHECVMKEPGGREGDILFLSLRSQERDDV